MSSEIFETIIARKIDVFLSMFKFDSDSIFKNGSKLIHPGEYGSYRERTFSDLLRSIINSHLNISDGFLVTSGNTVSTQCDVIIYRPYEVPILTSEVTNFYTIESVLSIGEIKSELSKYDFKKALVKLARNKMLGSERILHDSQNRRNSKEYDDLVTFLVCKNLNFDISSIDFDEIYEDIPRRYRHNFILSLEQGTWTYEQDFNEYPAEMKQIVNQRGFDTNAIVIKEHPVNITHNYTHQCSNHFIGLENTDDYYHIKCFLGMISTAVRLCTSFQTDVNKYLGLHIAECLSKS